MGGSGVATKMKRKGNTPCAFDGFSFSSVACDMHHGGTLGSGHRFSYTVDHGGGSRQILFVVRFYVTCVDILVYSKQVCTATSQKE